MERGSGRSYIEKKLYRKNSCQSLRVYYVQGTFPSALYIFSHLILTIILTGGCSYYLSFTDEATESQRLS